MAGFSLFFYFIFFFFIRELTAVKAVNIAFFSFNLSVIEDTYKFVFFKLVK